MHKRKHPGFHMANYSLRVILGFAQAWPWTLLEVWPFRLDVSEIAHHLSIRYDVNQ